MYHHKNIIRVFTAAGLYLENINITCEYIFDIEYLSITSILCAMYNTQHQGVVSRTALTNLSRTPQTMTELVNRTTYKSDSFLPRTVSPLAQHYKNVPKYYT